MKKSEAQRILEQLQSEIDILEAAKARIIAVQARVVPRAPRKKKARTLTEAASQQRIEALSGTTAASVVATKAS